MGLWGKSRCKDPEAGVHLVCWRKKEEPREAREAWGGESRRDEARELGREHTVSALRATVKT